MSVTNVSNDAIKAFLYVLITAAALFALKKKSISISALLIIGFVSLFDLWTVNRRYLNDDNFVDKTFADNLQTENSEYLMTKPEMTPSSKVFYNRPK